MASAPELGTDVTLSPPLTGRIRRRIRVVPAVCAGVGLAAWASGTTPFTDTAYVLAAAVALVMVAGAVGRWWRPGRCPWRALSAPIERTPTTWRTLAPWLAVIAVLVAGELVGYFLGGSRAVHPTMSSAVDSLFAHRPVKAAGFLGWLAGGWYLVRR